MRIFIFLLLFLTACTDAQPTKPVVDSSLLVKRSSMWVSDLDRAILFFQDVIGFEIESRKDLDLAPDSVIYDLFNVDPAADIRRVMFSSPSQVRALFVMEAEGAPQYELNDKRSSILLIRTDDMDGVISRAKQNGFTVGRTNISTSTKTGRISTETTIIGPDGNAVLMYQTTIGSSK